MKISTYAATLALIVAPFIAQAQKGSSPAESSCAANQLLGNKDIIPNGQRRCCEGKYGGGDYFGSCETSSCVANFGKKNLNCHNYGSNQNPVGGTKNKDPKTTPGGSNNCPFKEADRAICDTSYYTALNGKSCRNNGKGADKCLGRVKCNTNGVTIPKGKKTSDGTASGGGSCPYAEKGFGEGTLCFYDGDSDNFKVCGGSAAGNGGGDPHFQTFDGTQYSYHGECDLVFARNPSFANNLGLDIHIRTEGMGGWSLISNAAVRIGDDIFEFQNDGMHYINGHPMTLPYDMAGRYTVTKERKITEQDDGEGNIRTMDTTIATIQLDQDRYIRFSRFGKGIMFVRINGLLDDSEGMLGVHGIEGMVGRDGRTVLSDPDEMGAQWQVNDSDPMLFRESRAPQYPQTCILPDVGASQRRLRMSESEMMVAEKACRSVSDEFRDMCIQDVLFSGDIHSADGYLFGEAF